MPLMLFIITDGKFVFGSAKPVPINPYNFKNPKKDMALSSLAGPGVNIVMALSVHPAPAGCPAAASRSIPEGRLGLVCAAASA